jgi:phosphomannomutase
MQVSATSFKAYDIRGIVPSALNEEFALGLGRTFGTLANKWSPWVAMDA